jgi:hypothetical protein
MQRVNSFMRLAFTITALAFLFDTTPVRAQKARDWAWPITCNSNNRYLVNQEGKPFFALGDCLWKMHLYSPAEVALIFEDRKEKGFTVMCVATGCEGDLTNYRGDEAFIGDDLSQPNEAYWQHIDFIVQAALDRNMAVMFNPIWIRHHRERVDASGPNGCRDYGAWLARRFQRFENVMYFSSYDCLRMLEFIHGFEWWTLVPDHGNRTLIGGQGHYMGDQGDDYALAARTRDGRMMVAYTPVTHDLEIDLSRLSGPAKARWFNPVTGLFSEIGSVPNEGTRRFRSPGDNGTGREDWVLVIEVDN